MDERLAQLLEQAADHHPEYDLEPDDMLIITRISLQAFKDYCEKYFIERGVLASALDGIILAMPIDD